MKKRDLVIGVDISKNDFQVCIKECFSGEKAKIKGSWKFENNIKGFILLTGWVSKREKEDSFARYNKKPNYQYVRHKSVY